jgi:hypothetical protein
MKNERKKESKKETKKENKKERKKEIKKERKKERKKKKKYLCGTSVPCEQLRRARQERALPSMHVLDSTCNKRRFSSQISAMPAAKKGSVALSE